MNGEQLRQKLEHVRDKKEFVQSNLSLDIRVQLAESFLELVDAVLNNRNIPPNLRSDTIRKTERSIVDLYKGGDISFEQVIPYVERFSRLVEQEVIGSEP